jgi:hypothetical protein
MTIAEKALESDLHLAIQVMDVSQLDTAYAAGADFITGVFQLGAGKILLSIAVDWSAKNKAEVGALVTSPVGIVLSVVRIQTTISHCLDFDGFYPVASLLSFRPSLVLCLRLFSSSFSTSFCLSYSTSAVPLLLHFLVDPQKHGINDAAEGDIWWCN